MATARRQLALTSPLMHGPDVLGLQSWLASHGYFTSDRDGVYGPLTAQGVQRAKFWMGYPHPNQVAGDRFHRFTLGAKLPPSYVARSNARKRKLKDRPLREKALANLAAHLGEKEHPPNSNRISWASEWYGILGPWCAMAVTRAYIDAGSKVFKRRERYAYVPFIVHDARAGANHLTLTEHPSPGDLVCYDWQRDGIADHVGLFEKWIAGGEGVEFQAVEGNTAVGNDSNGGEVMRRTRKRNLVQAFVHVGR